MNNLLKGLIVTLGAMCSVEAAVLYIDGVRKEADRIEIWTKPEQIVPVPTPTPTPAPAHNSITPIGTSCNKQVTCINKTWPIIPTTKHEMSPSSVAAFRVITGTEIKAGSFSLVPTSYNGTWVTASISLFPGDFSVTSQCIKSGSELSIRWAQGIVNPRYCSLKTNTQYYINVAFRGETSPATTCSGNTCGFFYKNQ